MIVFIKFQYNKIVYDAYTYYVYSHNVLYNIAYRCWGFKI